MFIGCTMTVPLGRIPLSRIPQAGDFIIHIQFQSKRDLLLFGPALICKVQQQHF